MAAFQNGEEERRGFVAFENAYHGDTLGAASLGGVGRFFESIAGMGPQVTWARGLEDLEDSGCDHDCGGHHRALDSRRE